MVARKLVLALAATAALITANAGLTTPAYAGHDGDVAAGAAAGLVGEEPATYKKPGPMPVDLKPLPNEKTKLPWHMVNLWWTFPETPDFESLEKIGRAHV